MNYNFCRTHATIKASPAVETGVEEQAWKLKDIVEMMDNHYESKENAKFEKAFSRMRSPRTEPRAYAPNAPKTPWYLDPENGGPYPEVQKPGIAYEADENCPF